MALTVDFRDIIAARIERYAALAAAAISEASRRQHSHTWS